MRFYLPRFAEVVVAAVIVAVIGIILFPVITTHPHRGQHKAGCIYNLKQITVALAMYSEDYNERLPALKWMHAVAPYIKDDDTFRCPTVRKDAPTGYGYAFESSLAGNLLPKVASPITKPMVFDSGWLYRNAAGPFRAAICIPGRHKGMDAVGFVDGHVKTYSDAQIPAIIPAGQTSAR